MLEIIAVIVLRFGKYSFETDSDYNTRRWEWLGWTVKSQSDIPGIFVLTGHGYACPVVTSTINPVARWLADKEIEWVK